MLKEEEIEKLLREHLMKKGWIMQNSQRIRGQHGCDIIASHPRWRKTFYIEVKGEGKAKIQTIHNAFWTLLGQILSRMDIQGNDPKKSRYYAIAIPTSWERTYKNKIKKMAFGWKLLKLKVFLVSDKKIEEKSYSYFLKK